MSHHHRQRTHLEFKELAELKATREREAANRNVGGQAPKKVPVDQRIDRHRVHQVLHAVERDPLHEEVDEL